MIKKSLLWFVKLLFEKYIPLLLTAGLAVYGWHIIDNLSAQRDRANKQRDMRFEYLITAYSRLADATQREPKPESKYIRDMETAMADIQLFGTDSQITDAKKFMNEFQKNGRGSMNDLLKKLRNDLRREMDFSKVEGDVQYFRPEGIPPVKER